MLLKVSFSAEQWAGTSASVTSEAGQLQEDAEAWRRGNLPEVTRLGNDSSPVPQDAMSGSLALLQAFS